MGKLAYGWHGSARYVSPSITAAAAGGGCQYSLTDDEALAIDSAVAKLTKRNQQRGDFVWLYFGSKWTMVRLGESAGSPSEQQGRSSRAALASSMATCMGLARRRKKFIHAG